MNQTATLMYVSNEMLLAELQSRIDSGWLPLDPAYLADLLTRLGGSPEALTAAVSAQMQAASAAATVNEDLAYAAAVAEHPERANVFEWLRGQGYSAERARAFVTQMPGVHSNEEV